MSCEPLDDCKLPGEEFVASMDMSAAVTGGQTIDDASVSVIDTSSFSDLLSVKDITVNLMVIGFTVTGGSPGLYNLDVLAKLSDGQIVGQRIAMTVS